MKTFKLLPYLFVFGLGFMTINGLTAQDTVPAAPAPAPVPPAESTSPATPPTTPASESSPATPATEEVRKALPVAKVVITQPSPPLPPGLVSPAPGGPVMEFVGHRKTDKDGSGWGWIKKADEDWKKARWVTLRETAKSPAPWRALGKKDADEDYEYKMWGYFADHQVYDPIYDEMLEVFVLDHCETLGAATPLVRKTGPTERFISSHGRASRAGSRENRPMQSDSQSF